MNGRTLIIGAIIVVSYIAIISYVNVLCLSCSSTHSSTCSKEIGTKRYFGVIENESRKLMNNVWGATDEEKVVSYIYYKCDGSFGWKWNRPAIEGRATTEPIYPEVIVGTQPWRKSNESTSPYFPIRLKNINNWKNTVEYRYVDRVTGSFNLAYDIWLTDDLPPTYKKAEVMIWIHGHLHNSTPVGRVYDGINEYDYYTKRATNDAGESWNYYAFILKNQNIQSRYHDVNIKRLLDFLVRTGELNNDLYVNGIELGNEIWHGQGHVEIEKYVINLNGDII